MRENLDLSPILVELKVPPGERSIMVGDKKRDPRCKLTIRKELKAIELYKRGLSLSRVAAALNVSMRCIHNVLRAYDLKARSPGEGIRLLHKHIDATAPHDFPWHLRSKFIKLIAVFLLTDGNVRDNYAIRLICSDDVLQKYFLTLCKEEFGIAPTKDAFKKRQIETTIFSKEAYLKLLELSPSYKTCPHGKIRKYLKEKQPTLSFLKDEDLDLLKECVRIAMSAEGSIHLDFPRDTIYPRLEFACAHPKLIFEWQEIFKKVGIESTISKSKVTWSGVKGLRISKLNSIRKFIEIGGFINGVRITGKSKYFAGILKNQLLRKAFEMKLNGFRFPRHLTLKQKISLLLKQINASH